MPKPFLQNATPPPLESDSAEDLSLFRGGLFYRAQVVAHLIDSERWNVWLEVAIAVMIIWLPLVILTALYDRKQLTSFLLDYEVYSRVALAIPVLLVGQLVMEDRFRAVAKHVWEARLLGHEDLQKLNGVLSTIRRLRDSPLSELIIIALVLLDLVLIWKSRVATGPGWAVYRNGEVAHLTPAGWYYGLLCAPLYQFLIGLCIWKWALWCFFLFRLSRMELNLVATHPDGHGGLGFLGLSPIGFIPVAFGLSSVIGGSWASEIVHNGARLENFKLPAIIFVGLTFAVSLAPLTLFVYRLDGLRRRAMLQYGVLAQRYTAELHGKWFSHRSGSEEGQFTVAEVSTLADFSICYRNIKQMWAFPADRGAFIGLALAVTLPLLPAVLAQFSLLVIVKGLLQVVKAVPM